MKTMRVPRVAGGVLLAAISQALWATNGMNIEGYGPEATAMGGASMAYDNGTAAMMNNPATLGMREDGNRLDIFFGFLGPDVTTEIAGQSVESDGTAYYMPAFGWTRKLEKLTYGVGLYGQGGMGTEFGSTSPLSNPGAAYGVTSNLEQRTELSVGRIIAPVAYDVSDRLSVGGSLDLVWAGLDLKMAMSEAQFFNLATPGQQSIGTASGTMVNAFSTLYGAGTITEVHHAYFDFSNGSRFSGKARAYGLAGKLGATYKINNQWTIGGTYHSKTNLGDMKTKDASVRFGVRANFGAGAQNYDIPVTGTIKVKDFQWPSTWAVGAAYKPNGKWMFAGDIKRINWESVMKSFKMSFEADATQANQLAQGFAGQSMDVALFQNWDDQTVVQLGGAYQYNRQLTLRGGINVASNPVPDSFLNALFPAIPEKHLTLGFGYRFDDQQAIDFSFQHAFEKKVTNPGNGSTIPAFTSVHSQNSFQFVYRFLF